MDERSRNGWSSGYERKLPNPTGTRSEVGSRRERDPDEGDVKGGRMEDSGSDVSRTRDCVSQS